MDAIACLSKGVEVWPRLTSLATTICSVHHMLCELQLDSVFLAGPASASQLWLREPCLNPTWPCPGGASGTHLTGKEKKANLPISCEV